MLRTGGLRFGLHKAVDQRGLDSSTPSQTHGGRSARSSDATQVADILSQYERRIAIYSPRTRGDTRLHMRSHEQIQLIRSPSGAP